MVDVVTVFLTYLHPREKSTAVMRRLEENFML
jgi:hypothetical protein